MWGLRVNGYRISCPKRVNYYETRSFWNQTSGHTVHGSAMWTCMILSWGGCQHSPHSRWQRQRGRTWHWNSNVCFHPRLTCGNFFLHLAWGTDRNRCEHGLHFCSHSLGLLPSNLPFWQLIKDINTYIWNLEEWYRWAYVQGSKGDTDVKNRLFNLVGEGKGGMIWENSIETYTLPYVK